MHALNLKPTSPLRDLEEDAGREAAVRECAAALRRVSPGFDRPGLHRVFQQVFAEEDWQEYFPVFLREYFAARLNGVPERNPLPSAAEALVSAMPEAVLVVA